MNDFLEKLASGHRGHESSEHLTLLGRRAARIYADNEANSLTEAVGRVVGEEDLNKDQIRRVSETANQAAWQALLSQGDARSTFDPADAERVIGELDTTPDEVEVPNLDYLGDVPNQNTPDDVDLAELFGIKDDSEDYEALNPANTEMRQAEKVASAADVARLGTDQLLGDLALLGEKFYGLVKQAHLRDGIGILQISDAVGQVLDSPTYATAIMQQAASRLEHEGVKFDIDGETEKLAHRVVINTEHELLVTAVTLEKVAYSYYSAGENHQKLQEAHRRAHRALRDKLREV